MAANLPLADSAAGFLNHRSHGHRRITIWIVSGRGFLLRLSHCVSTGHNAVTVGKLNQRRIHRASCNDAAALPFALRQPLAPPPDAIVG
jgi:hypothetical protein